ncbi:MAG: MarR family winged helix-turn-helix transcriptional regulator [Sciscionella sp.]
MLKQLATVPGEHDEGRVEVADELSVQLIRFMRLVSRIGMHLAAQEKDGVESTAYILLAHLVCQGPARTSALAEAVHSDPSTISRQTAVLVRSGLVERRPDPSDGRACVLAATGKGERIFQHNRTQRDRHVATMLVGWSATELGDFVALLEKFNSDFENYRSTLLGHEYSHNEGEITG